MADAVFYNHVDEDEPPLPLQGTPIPNWDDLSEEDSSPPRTKSEPSRKHPKVTRFQTKDGRMVYRLCRFVGLANVTNVDPQLDEVAIAHRELSGEDHCCYTLSALAQRPPMAKNKKSRDKRSKRRKKGVAFPATDKHFDRSYCPAITHLDGAEGSKVKPLAKATVSSPNEVPANSVAILKEDGLQEVRPAPECLQDDPQPQKQELEEINIANEGEPRRPIFICKDLPAEQRGPLIELIKKYSDVFAWTYEQMPGLDKDVTMHRLNVIPLARPVKQGVRFYKPEVEFNIKDEMVKLFGAGFIKPIQHPTWLSSIVLVIKKNGQIRVCVDFRDLNKFCPKDEFPLSNIDTLINSAAGHHMFSFMDGFSDYNQIKMAPEDAPKMAFRTPIGNFFYTIMPFGLKSAGATYQRAMTAIFHDMLHKSLECYINDLVVKSKEETSHLRDLQRVLEHCKKYRLRMNPLKCAFGVTTGKFLGCIVHRHGRNPDTTKVTAIKNMPRPTNLDELRTFLGRASYLRWFIPAMAEITQPSLMFKHPLSHSTLVFKVYHCQPLPLQACLDLLLSTSGDLRPLKYPPSSWTTSNHTMPPFGKQKARLFWLK
ncbi:hypothetical protein CsSME_00036449 [Camellia sinensis var. sinensis]